MNHVLTLVLMHVAVIGCAVLLVCVVYVAYYQCRLTFGSPHRSESPKRIMPARGHYADFEPELILSRWRTRQNVTIGDGFTLPGRTTTGCATWLSLRTLHHAADTRNSERTR
jgi:hypothetical protein